MSAEQTAQNNTDDPAAADWAAAVADKQVGDTQVATTTVEQVAPAQFANFAGGAAGAPVPMLVSEVPMRPLVIALVLGGCNGGKDGPPPPTGDTGDTGDAGESAPED